MTELSARCADCLHAYGLHVGGYCSGDDPADPFDVALCGCAEFVEYEDDEWDDDDVEPCSMCGSPYCAEMCDDLPAIVPVVTAEPLARYL